MVVVLLTGTKSAGTSTVVNFLCKQKFRWIDVAWYLDHVSEDFCKEALESLFSPSEGLHPFTCIDNQTPWIENRTSSLQELPSTILSTDPHTARLPRLKALESRLLQHYKDNIVLTGISHVCDIQVLSSRPFTLVVGIDAPLALRFARWSPPCQKSGTSTASTDDLESPPKTNSLSSFTEIDAAISFGCPACEQLFAGPSSRNTNEQRDPETFASVRGLRNAGVYYCLQLADIVLCNTRTEKELLDSIARINITSPELCRPSYDAYFMQLALETAMRSNCLRRSVGAVITADNKVIATGYNGTPTGCINCLSGGCRRCCSVQTIRGANLESCICVHAEANALLQAGLARSHSATLYVTCFPCLGCAKLILQGEIRRLVYYAPYDDNPSTLQLFQQKNIEILQYRPTPRKKTCPIPYAS